MEYKLYHMKDTALESILSQVAGADLAPLSDFLLSDPSEPLVAAGSGGCESVGDFLALLRGTRGGVASAVTPLTLHSLSDAALRSGKVVLFSAGGHNADAVFAAKRCLGANPAKTAGVFLHDGERNGAMKLFRKAGSRNGFVVPVHKSKDGFVSTGTAASYFAILTRVFQPDADILGYSDRPSNPFTFCRNDGSPMDPRELRGVRSFVILHGSWGRPVATNLEGKLVETGFSGAFLCDYRNFCHGRFIYVSNHLEDSAIVMLVSPREKYFAERTRRFLPASAKLIIIETPSDAPEASLDLLLRGTDFFRTLCEATGANYLSPANPGKIDKRIPISVPFKTELEKMGPLTL